MSDLRSSTGFIVRRIAKRRAAGQGPRRRYGRRGYGRRGYGRRGYGPAPPRIRPPRIRPPRIRPPRIRPPKIRPPRIRSAPTRSETRDRIGVHVSRTAVRLVARPFVSGLRPRADAYAAIGELEILRKHLCTYPFFYAIVIKARHLDLRAKDTASRARRQSQPRIVHLQPQCQR